MNAPASRGIWLALRRAGLGSVNFAHLLKHFGDMEAAWRAAPGELRRAGIEPAYLRAVSRARANFDPEEELARMARAGARLITWADADYPPLLRDIPQSPPLLVLRGGGNPTLERAVAIVGTRRVTPYGRRAAQHFAGELSRAGVAIVSGLARGVDAIAHRTALKAGAVTVGVLAGGVDEIYPREHVSLAARIEKTGCVLSEYPIGVPARPDYFPRRNRILAGLARATLVIEAGEGSGALHTANWAFEQGRDVFAVPGSIFSSQGIGCHKLIRDNVASLVTDPGQILYELDMMAPGLQAPPPSSFAQAEDLSKGSLSAEEKQILEALAAGPRHVDELARQLAMPVEQLAAGLTVLELRSTVSQVGPMVYALAGPGRGLTLTPSRVDGNKPRTLNRNMK